MLKDFAFFGAFLVMTLAGPVAAAPASQWEFDGSFSDVRRGNEPECALFDAPDYHARHALAGPTLRTSVLRLDQIEGTQGGAKAGGFFDGLVFVGLLGGSNDLYYEKTIDRDGISYQLLAEGLVDRDVLYLELTVEAFRDGVAVCQAEATFSAFN